MILLYGNPMSAGSSVLRAFSTSNACFTCDEPSSKRVCGVGLGPKAAKATFAALHSAESHESDSKRRRCWENVIDAAC